ncbi:MAG: peptidoglycan DD-metalloendopeptidase family protein [Gammaproteobacteria bacterium]|nr:peptidoglycan DD-metalloendopeptidase family protein [Gammaproteobacteria bacterium]
MTARGRLMTMVMLLFLAGCGSTARAPIQGKAIPGESAASVSRGGTPVVRAREGSGTVPAPDTYRVRAGDTLHAISWRFGIDYRDLVSWNRLSDPDRIYVGQRLRLKAPPARKRAEVTVPSRSKPAPARKKSQATTVAGWRWPAKGRVETASSVLGSKGIRILGRRGETVSAAASGRVVYSGSGLRGYGQLIIIKHSDQFLSAYAHNQKLFAPEGASVRAGQRIAEMGDTDAKQVMLHFEIRRDGKPVDPLQYLPKR